MPQCKGSRAYLGLMLQRDKQAKSYCYMSYDSANCLDQPGIAAVRPSSGADGGENKRERRNVRRYRNPGQGYSLNRRRPCVWLRHALGTCRKVDHHEGHGLRLIGNAANAEATNFQQPG